MKKFFALTFAIIMVFTLTACGGGNGNNNDGTAATNESTPEPEATPTPEAQEEIEGEFFPGISDGDIPDILLRKAGRVESASLVASDDPEFTSEVLIVLSGCPMNFFSILSNHYETGSLTAELPLDESLGRSFTFDWGTLEMSSKDLIMESGEIHVHAFIY